MKTQKHIIKIDEPCKQDWNSMIPGNNGKYCLHCSKNVTDFSKMTDAEIIKVLKQTNGNICGRFNNDQLNRTLIQPPATLNYTLGYKILGGLLLFLNIGSVAGSGIQPKSSIPSQILTERTINKIVEDQNKNSRKTDNIKCVIQGKVFDEENNETLIGVNVRIKNTDFSVTTDIEGFYKFIIPEDLLNDSIIIEVSYVSYEIAEILIHKADLPMVKNIYLLPKFCDSTTEEIEFIVLGRIPVSNIGSLELTNYKKLNNPILQKIRTSFKNKWWQRKK